MGTGVILLIFFVFLENLRFELFYFLKQYEKKCDENIDTKRPILMSKRLYTKIFPSTHFIKTVQISLYVSLAMTSPDSIRVLAPEQFRMLVILTRSNMDWD